MPKKARDTRHFVAWILAAGRARQAPPIGPAGEDGAGDPRRSFPPMTRQLRRPCLALVAACQLAAAAVPAASQEEEVPPSPPPGIVEEPADGWPNGLHQAVYAGDVERVQALIDAGADVNARLNGDGMLPLQYAIARGSLELVDLLLDAGADLNASDGQGTTPLMHAAAAARPAIVDRLLDLGADVGAVNDIGWTALMSAAGIPRDRLAAFEMSEERLDALVRRLLEAGSEVGRASRHQGETALCLAAKEGYEMVVSTLLAAGAEIDHATAIDRMTPLMLAAHGGHLEAVDRLLEAGADIGLVDRVGRNAADWAVDHAEVVARLAAATLVTVPSRQGLSEEVPAEIRAAAAAELAKLGYPLDEKGFFHAVMEGDLTAIRHFLDAGMSPDTRDEAMERPLLRATSYCHHTDKPNVEIALALISAGADVNVRDTNGATPLIQAAQSCPLEVVEALLGAGADVDARAAGGATPLMMARVMGREEVVAALEAAGATAE